MQPTILRDFAIGPRERGILLEEHGLDLADRPAVEAFIGDLNTVTIFDVFWSLIRDRAALHGVTRDAFEDTCSLDTIESMLTVLSKDLLGASDAGRK